MVLKPLGEFIGLVEYLLDRAGHWCHLRNLSRAGSAWTMNSILPPQRLRLEHPPRFISSDQHDEIIQFEHSNRVSVGVENVVVSDSVLAGTCQDHGIHWHRVSLILPKGRRMHPRPDCARAIAGQRVRGPIGAPPGQSGEILARITQWFLPLGRSYSKPACSNRFFVPL